MLSLWATAGDDLGTHTVRDATPQPPIYIDIYISGRQVKFELDTGATVTVVSEDTFKNPFPYHRLKKSTLELKTYTGEPMDIVGEATVQVRYQNSKLQRLTLVVVKGNGPPLLGRNW